MAAAEGLGNIEESLMEQRGEKVSAVQTSFALIDSFRNLRLS
jgi:hypothetical protein